MKKCEICNETITAKYSSYRKKSNNELVHQCKRCFRYYKKAPLDTYYVGNGDERKN